MLLQLTLLGAVALPAPVEAQVRDRRVDWHTVRTEHFEVHYPEPLGVVARRAAATAEEAHRRLSTILAHDVDRRVQVVLTDDSDSANGSATSLPYNQMALFASAPEDLSPLGDYDDWLSVLVTHEHTHVLHLDTIAGAPAIVNAILGKVYAPNLIQPRWFIEGLATHEESRETAGGRLRSTMFEMYIRMDALEDRLLRLDQLSSSVDRWPRGNTWYLYGSRFVDWIAREHGREVLTAMSHEYGRRLVPYGVNRTAQRTTGHTFIELYGEWIAHLRAHHGAVRDAVIEAGRVEGERITFHGEIARSPRWLDDETLVYYVADGENDVQLRLLAPDGSAPRELHRVLGNSYPAPAEGGAVVYFDALDAHREIYFYFDLFRHDRRSGETERLTHGLRARAPDVAPDGRRVAFTVNGAATRHLMIADVEDVEATKRVLLRSRRFEQVYTPRWSPDGRWIAVSRWTEGGYRDIALVDPETGDVRPITHDRALDTGPAWSRDGRFLFFSSDRTGIANLYAHELASGRTWQVTNVVGGAYSPDVSPSGEELVYLGYTSHGFDLWRLPLDPARWRPATPYVDDRPPPSDPGELTLESERYRPWRTLYPRAYMLDLQEDAFGRQLGLTVESNDVANHHIYSARLGVSLAEGYVNGDLAWVFQRLPAPITLRGFRRVSPRGGLQVGGEDRRWIEDAIGGSVGIGYGFPRMLHAESISASYSLTWLRKAEPFGGELDPNTPPPVLPETGRVASLSLGWGYSDVRRHFYDMFPSEGRSLNLSLSLAHPSIGSQFEAVTFRWSWERYVEAPWAQHHVFALRYGGGLSGGDFGRRGLFSVGGFPSVNIIDAFMDELTLGGVALRGYPPFVRSGLRFHLAQLEYRFPLGRLMRGVQTLPVYLNRAYALVFVDAGDAFRGPFDPRETLVGAGGELFLDFTVGYIVGFTLRVGFGYGFMEGGGPQGYAHLGVPF
ncbi:MAG: hypothetical protein CMN29_25890 [Sandaracinus sp.]|nr:hypothetical protein [Myxococcales bacterium]MAT28347.1 hypothetical protein [Sandaracinus sp.]